VTAVGGEIGAEDAAIGALAGLLLAAKHHRSGPVAEQHAGAAVLPVDQARERFGANHQRGVCLTHADEIVGGGEGVNEASAHRLQVEGDARAGIEFTLDRRRRSRKGVVRRRSGDQDEIDVPGGHARPREGLLGGAGRQVGCQLSVRGQMPLTDARPLADPFIRGVDQAGQLRVGHHAGGQIRTDASHHRASHHGQEAVAATTGTAAAPVAPISSMIL